MSDSPESRASSAFSVAQKFGYNTIPDSPNNISWERALQDVAFTTHSIPDIQSGTEVIGVLTVPAYLSADNNSGYHVADFLAFATLTKDCAMVESQVWLASFDISTAMKKGGAVHAHSTQPEARIATQVTDILSDGDIQIMSPSEMRTRFLKEVASRSARGGPLVIFSCGETGLEQTIYFAGPSGPSVTKNEIRKQLDPSCRATIVTASPFTGGWHINPFLGRNPGYPEDTYSYLASIHCGGAFTTLHLGVFQNNDESPFVPDDVKPFIATYPNALTEHGCFNPEARDAHRDFHETVRRTFATRRTSYPGQHAFLFSSTDDEMIGDRSGLSLVAWKKKWDTLPTVSLSAKDAGYPILGTAFGGTKASQIRHVVCQVKLETQTCKGDWELHTMSATKKLFDNFLNQKEPPSESDLMHILDVIEFRSSSMIAADIVIDALGLRRPQGQMCRDWDFNEFAGKTKVDERLKQANWGAFEELPDQIFTHVAQEVGRVWDKNFSPTFSRPSLYVAAAIAEHAVRNFPSQTVQHLKLWANGFVEKFVDHAVYLIVDFQKRLILSDAKIQELGKNWIESLELTKESSRPIKRNGGLQMSCHAPKKHSGQASNRGTPQASPDPSVKHDEVGGWGTPPSVARDAVRDTAAMSSPTESDEEPMPPSASEAGRDPSPVFEVEVDMSLLSRDGPKEVPVPVSAELQKHEHPEKSSISVEEDQITEAPASSTPRENGIQAVSGEMQAGPAITVDDILGGIVAEIPEITALRPDLLRRVAEYIHQQAVRAQPVGSSTILKAIPTAKTVNQEQTPDIVEQVEVKTSKVEHHEYHGPATNLENETAPVTTVDEFKQESTTTTKVLTRDQPVRLNKEGADKRQNPATSRQAWTNAARSNEAAGFPGYPYVTAGSGFETDSYRKPSKPMIPPPSSPPQMRGHYGMLNNTFRVNSSPPHKQPVPKMGSDVMTGVLTENTNLARSQQNSSTQQMRQGSAQAAPAPLAERYPQARQAAVVENRIDAPPVKRKCSHTRDDSPVRPNRQASRGRQVYRGYRAQETENRIATPSVVSAHRGVQQQQPAQQPRSTSPGQQKQQPAVALSARMPATARLAVSPAPPPKPSPKPWENNPNFW